MKVKDLVKKLEQGGLTGEYDRQAKMIYRPFSEQEKREVIAAAQAALAKKLVKERARRGKISPSAMWKVISELTAWLRAVQKGTGIRLVDEYGFEEAIAALRRTTGGQK
jgi:predicted AlkP superfamily phosphohydrolase/phosphomutase